MPLAQGEELLEKRRGQAQATLPSPDRRDLPGLRYWEMHTLPSVIHSHSRRPRPTLKAEHLEARYPVSVSSTVSLSTGYMEGLQ